MAEIVNNLDRKLISSFVNRVINDPNKDPRLEGWVSEVDEHNYWMKIVRELSLIGNCEKIIKTKNNNEDVILFISEDISSKYVEKVMSKYFEILCKYEKYFDILVLNKEEVKRWANNSENEIYWENINGELQ